ncbi:mechanosensitive ion channel family protein [Chiayiivirga flava]|uniref:Small-conductance mechanosensitive channel n=1 Tax=Chiayiivirga flava TaxID=659595 RepID=A0A7W8D461_9GAMM|nr:mechanosensitive ion channel domain-containing protein [Chiayiivirga flava]MBB5207611.1 small-conductance mechanosensitive channel [Chiayiivirga flava]
MDLSARIDWDAMLAVAMPLGAAALLGLAVHLLLMRIARRVRAADSRRGRILRVIALPLAFAVPLLMLALALRATPLPPQALDWSQHAIRIALFACVTWLLVRVVSGIERAILRQYPIDVADNVHARRIHTQTRVLGRVVMGAIVLLGVATALMTFPAVRQVGATLLASAGIIGIAAGIAAKPVFSNLIAGLQIALAQPIRLDDVVIVEGEWGRIEEITASYVVVRIWDERRLVVPLTWFIEHPFQNWTRSTADMLGTAVLWLDYRTPMAAVRDELQRICSDDPRWDGKVCIAQVTDTSESTMQVRLLVSARNSGDAFDLRCAVREGLIAFLAREHPEALPRTRATLTRSGGDDGPSHAPAAETVRSPHAEDGELPGD